MISIQFLILNIQFPTKTMGCNKRIEAIKGNLNITNLGS
jgi:hypothetical protein